ncbi:MAG: hypothetical protein A2V98_24000 [Planctomycetes bacterium RBG_16_64_12]|nr:MAG: hypothetical protein A2V98_24000 [Planctomycetes bacterium RBG_16_64_12]
MDRHRELSAGVIPGHDLPEETANSVTHGIGLALSIAAAAPLLAAAALYGGFWLLAGCGIYAATLIAVYAASTLSHAFCGTPLRRLFRILDQAFIFLLIAGTYTPFALGYLRDVWWWLLTGLVWGIALAGFFSKTVWRHRIDATTVWAYVVLGWLPTIALARVVQILPFGVFWLMMIGGTCYMLGIVFLKLDRKFRYFHATWHVAVVAGSAFHYAAILFYVVPLPA